MRIQIKISADTSEEVKSQYEAFNLQMREQGLHQFHYNALNPLSIEVTYVDSVIWQAEQDKLNASCRNSLGSTLQTLGEPMINSILGVHDASGRRTR